ncbi:MAG: type II secretion system protein, partial [Ottowia sp.]|nr:type II secretion system protein [Ottowia sp.]
MSVRRGFTLVEVLIALTMLSLLMLALTSAVHGMGQAEARVERRIESGEDWRMTLNLLRQTL